MEPETKVRHSLYCTLGILNQILATSVEADAQTPYGRAPGCPVYLAFVPTNIPTKCSVGKLEALLGPGEQMCLIEEEELGLSWR